MITFYTMYNFQTSDRLFCIKCHFLGYGMIMRDSSVLTWCYEITEPLPQTLSSVYSINFGVHSMLKVITSSLPPDHSNLHHEYIDITLKGKYRTPLCRVHYLNFCSLSTYMREKSP